MIKSRLQIIDLRKDITIRGTVKAVDNYTKKTSTSLLEVPALFTYSYALQDGDKRAIDPELLPLLERIPAALPTDSEIYTIGIKKFTEKLQSTIIREAFKNN
ncbi:hypothetical protein [Flavobacterium reichenbachii]|uniref:Uncharacterized protein n=1 Tax=Flavobacterium reichenbachii TaxID=362418 RepID=A0A085ZNL4_9FLAO|nr:hypothetical protein [Flavobacterium reichenbachii]KFF06028.1 hypothetical protein IW19_11060 [Flavobacterium reichenbachii]OXB14746.1 hypothetical protein B0A68_11885 [Flavobacterium reichenbachii]